MKKYLAEMVGTMVLVLMGCGVATSVGCGEPAGVVATAFAFGLSVVAMAYTIGGISGCHINPAITLGCLLAGRIGKKDAAYYVLFQVIGGLIGAALLYVLRPESGLGANMLQMHDLVPITEIQGLLAEIFFTCVFVLVVLGSTDEKRGAGSFAGLAIGLSLVLVHLVCIYYTGTSVNPARSVGPALLAGGQAIADLWIFIVGPFVGAAIAAGIWKVLTCDKCCKA